MLLLLLQPYGVEQLAKPRSLYERCPKHWIDSSRKFQDHQQTQDNKINLNDDYNKNTNNYNKNNYELKHMHVHSYRP